MGIGTNKFKWNTNAGFLKYIFGPISHVTIHRSIHLMARASPLRHEGRCAEETSSVNHVWEEDCRSCRDAEIRFAVPLWGIFLMHVCSCVCDVCVWRVTLLHPQKSPSVDSPNSKASQKCTSSFRFFPDFTPSAKRNSLHNAREARNFRPGLAETRWAKRLKMRNTNTGGRS